MSKVGTSIDKVRAKLAAKASKFMPDICDLILSTVSPDGAGNSTVADSTVASGIPCKYELLSSYDRAQQSAISEGLTHQIEMPYTDTTRAITSRHRIKVIARSGTSEIIFDQPMFLPDSMTAFAKIAARVVT